MPTIRATRNLTRNYDMYISPPRPPTKATLISNPCNQCIYYRLSIKRFYTIVSIRPPPPYMILPSHARQDRLQKLPTRTLTISEHANPIHVCFTKIHEDTLRLSTYHARKSQTIKKKRTSTVSYTLSTQHIHTQGNSKI